MNKIPFYLVTGFLGSGKTTFIKRHLEQYADRRKIAIIQNEFAPANIDGAELKNTGKPFDLLEINNGSVFCVCIQSGFKVSLAAFTETYQPDVLILESSGLSDPIAVAEILNDPKLANSMYLAGSMCVVDTPNFDKTGNMVMRLRHQVAVADRIILNKTDLADEPTIAKVREQVRALNPFADIVETSYCRNVDFNELFDESENQVRGYQTKNVDGLEGCGKPQIGVGVMKSARAISRENLESFVKEYLPHTYRIKGFVKLDTGNYLAVQSSHDTVTYEEVSSFTGNTELIAMGETLDIRSFGRRFREMVIA